MKRGELYRIRSPRGDPKRSRVYIVVSRQILLDSMFSTVICAPVYTARHGIATQIPVGPDEGLQHDSAIHCDQLVSLPKNGLTDYVGTLPERRTPELDRALAVALHLI